MIAVEDTGEPHSGCKFVAACRTAVASSYAVGVMNHTYMVSAADSAVVDCTSCSLKLTSSHLDDATLHWNADSDYTFEHGGQGLG